MTGKPLFERLSKLGMPLLETDDEFDVNQTLAEVVKSKETRLWEGFPVLLVNAAKDFRLESDCPLPFERLIVFLTVFSRVSTENGFSR